MSERLYAGGTPGVAQAFGARKTANLASNSGYFAVPLVAGSDELPPFETPLQFASFSDSMLQGGILRVYAKSLTNVLITRFLTRNEILATGTQSCPFRAELRISGGGWSDRILFDIANGTTIQVPPSAQCDLSVVGPPTIVRLQEGGEPTGDIGVIGSLVSFSFLPIEKPAQRRTARLTEVLTNVPGPTLNTVAPVPPHATHLSYFEATQVVGSVGLPTALNIACEGPSDITIPVATVPPGQRVTLPGTARGVSLSGANTAAVLVFELEY